MSHLAIYVTGQTAGVVSGFRITGGSFPSTGSVNIPWETPDIPFTATPEQVNRQIQNSAIAAALIEGHSVAAFDNLLVIGAAVGGV